MCTAITMQNFFGRNLDLEYSYNEKLIITPQNYNFVFFDKRITDKKYAIMGIGIIEENYPLYYDAFNEHGIAGAGLNFAYDDLYSHDFNENKLNVAPFEVLTVVLRCCKNLNEVKDLLKNTNIICKDFNKEFKSTSLHFMFSDGKNSVTVESKDGEIFLYDNKINLLTNTPDFLEQLKNNNKYNHLTALETSTKLNSKGNGSVGLPGDFTSTSRFIKTAFLLKHSVCEDNEKIAHFFHILDAVAVPKGSINLGENKYFYTRYTSCVDLNNKIYYYKTYENNRVSAAVLTNTNASELIKFELFKKNDIRYHN